MEENKTKEFEFFGGSLNGFLMCFIAIILWGCAIFSLISGIIAADAERSCAGWFVTFALLVIIAVICSCGFTMLEPNECWLVCDLRPARNYSCYLLLWLHNART